MARDMSSWFQGKLSAISDLISETADTAASEGKNITQHHIDTRGTVKSGKRGRVETSRMRDAVDGEVSDVTPQSATASFGWLSGNPDYSWFQELGFVHQGGATIEGMYALTDAREEVVQNVREELRRGVRDL